MMENLWKNIIAQKSDSTNKQPQDTWTIGWGGIVMRKAVGRENGKFLLKIDK